MRRNGNMFVMHSYKKANKDYYNPNFGIRNIIDATASVAYEGNEDIRRKGGVSSLHHHTAVKLR